MVTLVCIIGLRNLNFFVLYLNWVSQVRLQLVLYNLVVREDFEELQGALKLLMHERQVNLFEHDVKIYSFCSSGLLLNLKLDSH